MFCNKCGKELPDDAKFCTNCGAQFGPAEEVQQTEVAVVKPVCPYIEADDADDFTPVQKKAIVKILAIISYLGLSVLLPVFLFKDKKYVRHHANNGLVLLIFEAAAGILSAIPYLGWFTGIPVLIAISVYQIIGVVNAACGVPFDMPIIGKIKILK